MSQDNNFPHKDENVDLTPANDPTEEAAKNKRKNFRLPNVAHRLGSTIENVTEQASNIFNKIPSAIGQLTNEQSKAIELNLATQEDSVPEGGTANAILAIDKLPEQAKKFLTWLESKNKGTVELIEFNTPSPQPTETGLIRLKENMLFAQNYLFVFAPIANQDLTEQLLELASANLDLKYGGIIIFSQEWPSERYSLEKEICVFIEAQKTRVGKDSPGVNYITDWLAETANSNQTRWEKKELLATQTASSNLISSKQFNQKVTTFFLGREAEFASLARSILTLDTFYYREPQKEFPWIFSIWGEGGNGKSYFIDNLPELLAPRICYAKVDFQGRPLADTEDGLTFLLAQLAKEFNKGGCPTSKFDNIYKEYRVSQERLAGKTAKGEPIFESSEVAKGLKEALGGASARTFAKNASKAGGFGFVKHLPGIINMSGTLAEVGLGLYDRLSQEQQIQNDVILRSQIIEKLTISLLEDLEKFVVEQRKKYLLWQRPVVVFDTYEAVGTLADQWLRTKFLTHAAIKTICPVVIIAGRFKLLRYNTRWSHFQMALQTLHFKSFSQEVSFTYLKNLGVKDETTAQTFYDLTQGSPLFLQLVASLGNREEAIHALKDRILEEIEPQYHNIFIEMAVADGFNLETVEELLKSIKSEGKSSENSRKDTPQHIFELLVRATFIEPDNKKFHYLPIVRQVLVSYLKLQNPQRAAFLGNLFGLS